MPNLERFGSYVLLKKIATGGMAELYKAKKSGEKGFEKLLAIKMILPHFAENDEFISMFIDEAKVAANLNHQNIVQIYDLGKIEDSYCIVMEYVRGKDLKNVLSRGVRAKRPVSPEHACLITCAALEGLSYAHRKKDRGRELSIVHRDVSPQNVIVSYEGEVKIVDFGIAKAATKSSETKAGVLKGKLAYMSPEQARGRPLDQRSDIFSTGLVLYEMLTGTRLFQGDTDLATLEKVREARVEPLPTEIRKDIPAELEAILLKSLAKEPENRFQTAAEMEEALQEFMRRAGWSMNSYSLSQYMYKLFWEDMEEELREEELWDQTIVSETKDEDTLASARVKAPSADATLQRQQRPAPAPPPHLTSRDEVKDRPALRPGFIAALVLAAGLGAGGMWLQARIGDTPPQPAPTPAPVSAPVSAPAAVPEPVAPKPPPSASPEETQRQEPAPLPEHGRQAPPEHSRPEPPPHAEPQRIVVAAIGIESSPPGARIYIDGEDTGRVTPNSVDGLSPDRDYRVRLTLDGFAPYEETVTPRGGRAHVGATLTQLYGRLTVNSKPWAVVFVDGEEKGMTPLADIRLTAGEHDLLLGNKRLRIRHEMKVNIEPDKTTRIVVDLSGEAQREGPGDRRPRP